MRTRIIEEVLGETMSHMLPSTAPMGSPMALVTRVRHEITRGLCCFRSRAVRLMFFHPPAFFRTLPFETIFDNPSPGRSETPVVALVPRLFWAG